MIDNSLFGYFDFVCQPDVVGGGAKEKGEGAWLDDTVEVAVDEGEVISSEGEGDATGLAATQEDAGETTQLTVGENHGADIIAHVELHHFFAIVVACVGEGEGKG